MQTIRTKLGKRLRELRVTLGWSQERLGEKADLHPTYVGSIERGERNVSLENLAKLSKAFRISLSELFEFPSGVEQKENLLKIRIKELIADQDEDTLKLFLAFQEQILEFKKGIRKGDSKD